MAVEVLIDEPGLRLGVIGPHVVAQWTRPPSAPELMRMRNVLRPWVARVGAFAAINLIDIGQLVPMDELARHEVATTQRLFAKEQRALANVIEGKGFLAASARSIVASLALLSRAPFEQRTFGEIESAATWVTGFFPGTSVADLVGATETVRAR